MPTLNIIIGPSKSGKSTYAKDFITYHPNTVELSRDYLRYKVVAPEFDKWGDYEYDAQVEDLVTKHMLDIFSDAVINKQDILMSDTNLNGFYRREWVHLGLRAGYKVKYIVFKTAADNLRARVQPRSFYLDSSKEANQLKRMLDFLKQPLDSRIEYVYV